MSGLRAKIAEKKAAAAGVAPPPAASPPPVPAPAATKAPAPAAAAASAAGATAAPAPAPAPAPAAAPKPKAGTAPKSVVKKGFLNQNAGALYPEGSNEQSPELWRKKQTAPVLEVVTSEKQYEVVGRFTAAGHYVGKEDFDISRTGATLRVRAKAPEEGAPESLISGIDESVQLPLDADFESVSADFSHYTLRITVPRLSPEQVTARVLPPELLRKLESLSMEQAQALLPEGIGPEELIKRLEALPDPGGPAAAGASALPPAPPPAPEPEEEIEEIETPGVAADRDR